MQTTMDEKVKMILKYTDEDASLLNILTDLEYVAAAVLHREHLLQDLFQMRKVINTKFRPLSLRDLVRQLKKGRMCPPQLYKKPAWDSFT